jgi:hypothetical protein
MPRTPNRRRHDGQGNRAPIPYTAVRAAYDAHKGSEPRGQIGRACRTCARYLAAVTLAARTANEGLS